jgi:hypothetical protein
MMDRIYHKAMSRFFASIAQRMHEGQINYAISKSAQHNFMVNGPLSKVPPRILVEVGSDGTTKVRHDVNVIEEMCRKINEA